MSIYRELDPMPKHRTQKEKFSQDKQTKCDTSKLAY